MAASRAEANACPIDEAYHAARGPLDCFDPGVARFVVPPMKGLVCSAIVFFLALTRWAQEPVAVIYVSRSEAAKAKQMTQELKGAQDRERTASPIAATALARG